MKITKLEPVTRTYCDHCTGELTNTTHHVTTFDDRTDLHECSMCHYMHEHRIKKFKRRLKAIRNIMVQPFFELRT